MRPPECRVPLWNGDSPSLESLRIGDSPSPGYWYNSIFGPSRVGMDNHLHLIVHVPPVPKEYWLARLS